MSETTTQHDEARAAADFTRQTRRRRVFFAVGAFGVASIAVVGGLFLFGGQLQTAEKARAGQARDELRRRFDAYRPQCPGLWRAVHAVEWSQIPEIRSRPLAARLAAGDLSCQDVGDLARGLPQKAGGVQPPAATAEPSSAPVPIIRLGPGIRLGPPRPASAPAPSPASAPGAAPAAAP
ncbi:MAG: hypothetical protein HY906_12485 [Deltaproteobacteria bacterium]|nr:hypothetical protein [Deltaproteobacteria bacterium]